MRTVDLNKNLVDLAGRDTQENQGKMLAQLLGASKDGDAIKYWEWATTLYSGQALSLHDNDFLELVEFVKTCSLLTVAGRAQLLMSLNASQGI